MIITLLCVDELGEQSRMLLVCCEASGSCTALILCILPKLPALVPPSCWGTGQEVENPGRMILLVLVPSWSTSWSSLA